jgi:putative sugar O-methyltransferase
MNEHFKASEVWNKINNNLLFNYNNINYDNFREANSINSKITTWNPYEPSLRYFKSLLYNIISTSTEEFFKIYNKIQNTELGNPISIKYKDNNFNLDYILSTNEILFLKDNIIDVKKICEIGGGFGRTAHAMLYNFDNIEKYYIIDLPNCLALSRNYLHLVLPSNLYQKCIFISTEDLDINNFIQIDLFINIDSFAEMDREVIFNYLKLISTYGKFFYSKNTIGKYNPKDIGLLNINNEDIDNIFKTGLCVDLLDIFNSDDLYFNLEKYNQAYKPNNYSIIIKSKLSSPFYYYGDVLYNV